MSVPVVAAVVLCLASASHATIAVADEMHAATTANAFEPGQIAVVASCQADADIINSCGTRYYKTGGYVLANARVDFDVTEFATLGAGGRNLFDKAYTLADGYPSEGSTVFVSLRLTN